MIAQFIESLVVSINIGRPSFFDDKDFSVWGEIFDFIETCPMDINVNGVYGKMKQYCESKLGYGGSGYQFRFWFHSIEDCAAFEKGINEIWEKYHPGYQMISPFNRHMEIAKPKE